MIKNKIYNKYSDYLKEKYGEKVYKLPINLPISCPNRVYGNGCSFYYFILMTSLNQWNLNIFVLVVKV